MVPQRSPAVRFRVRDCNGNPFARHEQKIAVESPTTANGKLTFEEDFPAGGTPKQLIIDNGKLTMW